MLTDGTYTYTWDAEGKMLSVATSGSSTASVTYDALGRAVEIALGSQYTQFVYDPLGNKLALMSGQTLSKAFVPLPGGATAVYNASGLAYYRHPDWLGSSRFASTPSRTMFYDGAYAPYGENYKETGTQDRNFTGQNQDIVNSGPYPLYDFLMREYHPTWGRWLSPDPAGLAAADPSNPQSWNRYAYVLNNPLGLVDPTGLSYCDNHPRPCNHAAIALAHLEFLTELGASRMGDCEGGEFCDEIDAGFSWGAVLNGLTEGDSGPLSGDYGANLPPPPPPGVGTGSLACDFGTCGAAPITGFIPDGLYTFNLKDLWSAVSPLVKTEVCGNSPGDAYWKSVEIGAGKGAIIGAIEGGATGTVLGKGVGAVPGAILGGIVGGTTGANVGIFITGPLSAAGCSLAGVYKK